ncbi:hypothetical protein LMH87_000387 [Akanthomyces muscarius]|uniref:Uncharacterized protein n=1 Tax=Akanthomyces muscarius TaxID=2231603 RepID=A0A9W8QH84_AKAMU|nr:hypothetical protein LMH87_000387 [Akanthomyces muscarius]KAJ4155123.1 hypothetical protein LMH87_000387 [Akanthomyces muscarius]
MILAAKQLWSGHRSGSGRILAETIAEHLHQIVKLPEHIVVAGQILSARNSNPPLPKGPVLARHTAARRAEALVP